MSTTTLSLATTTTAPPCIDLEAWVLDVFGPLSDMRVRPVEIGGRTYRAVSGVFCATMLEFDLDDAGTPFARVMGVCNTCECLVPNPRARVSTRMSAATTQVRTPSLRSPQDFYRSYGYWAPDSPIGPVGMGSASCKDCVPR